MARALSCGLLRARCITSLHRSRISGSDHSAGRPLSRLFSIAISRASLVLTSPSSANTSARIRTLIRARSKRDNSCGSSGANWITPRAKSARNSSISCSSLSFSATPHPSAGAVRRKGGGGGRVRTNPAFGGQPSLLLSAERLGTVAIMRRTGKAKPSVWRWQARYLEAGVDGLLRDKTRPARIPRLAGELVERVVARTLGRHRARRPTGRCAPWRPRSGSPPPRCSGSGWRTACSRTGCGPSSSPRTRRSRPSCVMWWAFMSTLRRTAWCCRSTRNPRSRRSTARSRACR